MTDVTKTFYVHRSHTGDVHCRVVSSDDRDYPLPHVVRHSPMGFECGYGGSGPADLARSICYELYGAGDPRVRRYQAVKEQIVAKLHRNPETVQEITQEQVDAVVGPRPPLRTVDDVLSFFFDEHEETSRTGQFERVPKLDGRGVDIGSVHAYDALLAALGQGETSKVWARACAEFDRLMNPHEDCGGEGCDVCDHRGTTV